MIIISQICFWNESGFRDEEIAVCQILGKNYLKYVSNFWICVGFQLVFLAWLLVFTWKQFAYTPKFLALKELGTHLPYSYTLNSGYSMNLLSFSSSIILATIMLPWKCFPWTFLILLQGGAINNHITSIVCLTLMEIVPYLDYKSRLILCEIALSLKHF